MFRPLASLLHRSGVFSYLRNAWRQDDTRLRESLQSALRDEFQAEVSRQVSEATAPLTQTIAELRSRQTDLRHEVKLLRTILTENSRRALEQYPRARDVEAVRSHATAAIAGAVLEPSPMPHMVVRDIFPDDTYRALIASIPPDECFSDRDLIKQNFKPAQGKLAPEFTTAMWTFLEDAVIARVLTPALTARFAPYIQQTYIERYGASGAAAAALPHEATAGRLMLRRPGYHLDPHLDPKRVIVTCLLYFARPGDDVSYGTQLFAINGVPRIDQSKTFYPQQAGFECQLATTVPFTPNTAVIFLNAGAGAHGATIPATAPPDTKRYAYQFYVSPDPERLAAVTGETAGEALETQYQA